MNTNIAVVLLAVCGALAFSAGCGKNEGIPPPAAKTTQTPADAAAAQSQKAAENEFAHCLVCLAVTPWPA
jgi:hypothetical protein